MYVFYNAQSSGQFLGYYFSQNIIYSTFYGLNLFQCNTCGGHLGLLLYPYVLILHFKCKNQNANLELSFFSWCCVPCAGQTAPNKKGSRGPSSTLLLMIGQMIEHSDWLISKLFVLDDWAEKF